MYAKFLSNAIMSAFWGGVGADTKKQLTWQTKHFRRCGVFCLVFFCWSQTHLELLKKTQKRVSKLVVYYLLLHPLTKLTRCKWQTTLSAWEKITVGWKSNWLAANGKRPFPPEKKNHCRLKEQLTRYVKGPRLKDMQADPSTAFIGDKKTLQDSNWRNRWLR